MSFNIRAFFTMLILLAVVLVGCGENSNKPAKTKENKQTTQKTHRCGRSWNGDQDATYGAYGDYCCEKCYVDLFPN